MPIPGCDCSDCRSERRGVYGGSAVDRLVREAGETLKDRAWRAYVEHCRDAERKALLIDELKQRTQRSSMSLLSGASYTVRIDPSMLSGASMFSPSYFNNLGGSSMSSSFPPNDPTTTEGIANAVKSLAARDNDADLSKVSNAVKVVEAERKARVEKALAGVADLEILGGTKAKRFVIAYRRGGETGLAYGTEYPVKLDDDGDPKGYSVYIDDYGHPFTSKYETVKAFTKSLEGTPYHIAYFDK